VNSGVEKQISCRHIQIYCQNQVCVCIIESLCCIECKHGTKCRSQLHSMKRNWMSISSSVSKIFLIKCVVYLGTECIIL
jgi:hypothetical protein